MAKKKAYDNNWIGVILIIFIIIILFVTLGNLNLKKVPKELKDSKEDAEKLYAENLKKLEDKQGLKKKLDKRVSLGFLFFRVLIVFIWGGLLFIGGHVGIINDIEDVLNYSGGALLALLTVNFIIFGTFSSLESFVTFFKMRIQNLIYRKYANLDMEIETTKQELIRLESV